MNGINIWSGEKGFGGALTNPTCLAKRKGSIARDYPVEFNGKQYAESEAAYKANKHGSFDKLQQLMVAILLAKLRQYDRLQQEIAKRGGNAWLATCRHVVNGGRWEGVGEDSAFIRCLMEAWRTLQ